MPLNENAKKWVQALRSGEYRQGKHALRRFTPDGDELCCLGVACEVYQAEVGDLNIDTGPINVTYNGATSCLPKSVREWLGISHNGGGFTTDETRCETLIALNDYGSTFAEIADIIESEPKGLFVEQA